MLWGAHAGSEPAAEEHWEKKARGVRARYCHLRDGALALVSSTVRRVLPAYTDAKEERSNRRRCAMLAGRLPLRATTYCMASCVLPCRYPQLRMAMLDGARGRWAERSSRDPYRSRGFRLNPLERDYHHGCHPRIATHLNAACEDCTHRAVPRCINNDAAPRSATRLRSGRDTCQAVCATTSITGLFTVSSLQSPVPRSSEETAEDHGL